MDYRNKHRISEQWWKMEHVGPFFNDTKDCCVDL